MKIKGIILFLVLSSNAIGQEVVVKSFENLQTDLTARTQQKLDANGNPCAVVKVDIPLEDVVFKGWVVESVSTPGEYLVYMPEGATKITLQHNSFTPYTYEFDKPLDGKQTYRLVATINRDGKIKPVYKVIEVGQDIKELYEKGVKYFDKDEKEKALKCFSEAADAGYAPAQNKMGNMSNDPKKAIEWYQKAASQGYPNSIYNLGQYYRIGEGVQRDEEQAFKYYMEAADLNFPLALSMVGFCYNNGWGTPLDIGKAFWYYKKAAELGESEGQLQLAICYLRGIGTKMDKTKGIEWLEKAANQGLPAAQGAMGNCYFDGEGVETDGSKAFMWYKKSAEQGDEMGEIGMGLCYDKGVGVKADLKSAVYWYQKAALKGNPVAQTNLGSCYWKGDLCIDIKKLQIRDMQKLNVD